MNASPWWRQLWHRWTVKPDAHSIPEPLWQATLQSHPFLAQRSADQLWHLRTLCAQFLRSKEFTGAQGLQITDEIALSIAAQACLPVLGLGLHWYEDFRGIVVHPSAMLAPRQLQDEAGVVHSYEEELSGEAMPGGPVTLSWDDVQGVLPDAGYNVVIHEFAHKLDMRDGVADGCPPLPAALRPRWAAQMQEAFDGFTDALEKAERFGGPVPWLDPYAATAPAEFFAVACEAYFVNRARFAQEFPALRVLFDEFFEPASPLQG